MATVCGNIGRKGEKINRNKERMHRRWLFTRFNVRLFRPRKNRKEGFCHAWRRHGSHTNIHKHHDRVRGLDENAPQAEAASRFYSQEKMEFARTQFLLANEQTMREMAAKVDRGELGSAKFSATIEIQKPVGEGLYEVPTHGDIAHVRNVRHVSFSYLYVDGVWYERTGYPNAKATFLANASSRSVVVL